MNCQDELAQGILMVTSRVSRESQIRRKLTCLCRPVPGLGPLVHNGAKPARGQAVPEP